MSDAFNPPPINPYDPPKRTALEFPVDGPLYTAPPSIPTFCKVVFIISIVLCGLRMIMALLGTLGYVAMGAEISPVVPESAILGELVSGWAIAIFGITGNTLLLMRKPAGAVFGLLCVVSVFASIGVGFWQLGYIFEQFPEGSPQRIGAYLGAATAIMVRAALAILLVFAILRFSRWHKQFGSPAQPDYR